MIARPPATPRRRQAGVALLALLATLILAAAYGLYRASNYSQGGLQERETVQLRLVQAKEALIAYAVNDNVRPGRLPCPDTAGDGNAALLTRDDCDAYSGFLPWKTLRLTAGTDEQGQSLRYALSPFFGGQRSLPPLNSDTATTLRLDVPDGTASNDIVAVVIAPRGPLDARNADGDDYYANGTSGRPDDNDLVVAVTRQELMAAVEQRIANQLRTCLEQHAGSNENAEHSYPWPAPLANAIYKGTAGSRFGMVPDTQAGNPGQVLKESIAKLRTTQTTLATAPTVAEQLAAATALQGQAAYLRALFDRLFTVAVALSNTATASQTAFSTLDAKMATATVSASAFTAQAASLPAAISSAAPSLAAFQESLENSGFDLFLMELQLQNPKLASSIQTATATPTSTNFGHLLTPVNLFRNSLLNFSWTPNTDIETSIAGAHTMAGTAASAVRAARLQPVAPWATEALTQATHLYNANGQIETAVLANRINIDPAEVAARAVGTTNALESVIAAGYSSASLTALVTLLDTSRVLTNSLSTGAAPLNTLRTGTLAALDGALAAARAGSDQALIRTSTESAASQLNGLSTALANQGDNVARETLKMVAPRLTAPANVTAARSLRANEIATVIYWSGIAISQSADIARLARKGVTAQEDSDTSAYTAARQLLASMDGEQDSIALLERAKARPDDADAQQAAQRALAETQTLLGALLDAAGRLDSALDTGIAQAAVPTLWYSQACSFLQPGTGSTATWWSAHDWKSLFFYQISDRIRPASGQLTVNGQGAYRIVAIAAGKQLVSQSRSLRETRSFLEKANADTSRDGLAQSPTNRFVVESVTPSFNDRLAY